MGCERKRRTDGGGGGKEELWFGRVERVWRYRSSLGWQESDAYLVLVTTFLVEGRRAYEREQHTYTTSACTYQSFTLSRLLGHNLRDGTREEQSNQHGAW